MRTSIRILILPLSVAVGVSSAQQAPSTTAEYSSQPGRMSTAKTVKASVVVIGIDRAHRILTLKGTSGKTVDIVAGPEVRNFDQIALRDRVVVQYIRALTLDLHKGGGIRESAESTEAMRTKAGEKPGVAVGAQITVMADVIGLNQKEKTITLRGPKGNVVVLDVENPDHFKTVRKGDQVAADYVEALAVSVEKAPVR